MKLKRILSAVAAFALCASLAGCGASASSAAESVAEPASSEAVSTVEEASPETSTESAALLAKAPIEAVFCNGATAYKIYCKYLQPISGIAAVKLPSTSPANAACRPEKLKEMWGEALKSWIV